MRPTTFTASSMRPQSEQGLPPETIVTSALDEQIRRRVFELYVLRGMENGHALDDWLQAETEFDVEQKSIAA